ncbi:hypothetical protein MPEAHAMD_7294 [Methylobacterium frigidaeris]|uniref:Uncharacterized protein n=1 Tax=Methylobacterium frigidaeris TaxID=2038277 RepID=A0AA37HKB0_9HYPH|nr:hypothetical protein MPEAHAMD_7294 [Methylobacterium frigidaeris]
MMFPLFPMNTYFPLLSLLLWMSIFPACFRSRVIPQRRPTQ